MDQAREALETALTAHFMGERLGRLAGGYTARAGVPSLLLWINAWHPLPDLLTWLAVLGWASCIALAVILTIASERWRARVGKALPDARHLVRIQFSEAEPRMVLSAIWFSLAAVASALLWVHGLRPGLIAAPVVAVSLRVWLVLLLAALAGRSQEGWA